MYSWQKIKSMKQEGFSIKKIAGTFNISKNTVKKYSRSLEPLISHKQNVQKKIDLYLDAVQEMVEKKYIGTRIYRELLKMGCPGCVDNIWRYVRQVKMESLDTKMTF